MEKTKQPKQCKPFKLLFGIIFALLFIWLVFLHVKNPSPSSGVQVTIQLLELLFLGASLSCFLPFKRLLAGESKIQKPKAQRRLTKRTWLSLFMILLAVPLTMFIGIYYLNDKKYYFISLMIILETFIPFCVMFEAKRPQARELVIVSVMCALAVAGRAVFNMIPQFKPIVAMVILAGVAFGGETGFLVGAVSGFLSNFFFGQGAWTPWQMFCFGIIGFLAGILFRKGLLRRTRLSLSVFGFFSVLLLYGGIMNPVSLFMWQPDPNLSMILSSYVMGIPFDLVHGAATAFFLWFLAEPMLEKLDRIKMKYGILK